MQENSVRDHVQPWQQRQWEQLMLAHQQHRLPHALLFSGHRGLGKFAFATQLATLLLCQTQNACGHCSACQLVHAGTHPDLICLTPEDPEKPSLKIEHIRELTYRISQTSHAGGLQIVIIDPVDALSHGGANALLKSIEEPTGSCLFILISDRPAALLATLRSRCQWIRFGAASLEETTVFFEKQGLPKDQTPLLFQLSGGAPYLALSLWDAQRLTQRASFFNELHGVISGHGDPVGLADAHQSVPLGLLIDWLESVIQDWIRINCGLSSAIVNTDLFDGQYKSLMQPAGMLTRHSLDALYHLYEHIQMVRILLMSGGHLNTLMLLEDVLIRLHHFVKRHSIRLS